MNVACEQALLFGRAKRVSGERASERQRKDRRACSQAKMNILFITLQATTHEAGKSGDVPMEHHGRGFRGEVKLRGPGSGHKDPFVRRPREFRAIIVPTAGNTGFFFENAETDPVFLNQR